MHWDTIHKDTAPGVTPNLADYDRARSDFTWSQARTALAGLPGGGLNIAHEAVDRHAGSASRDRVALRCIARDNSVSTVAYTELARRTARFANVLRSLGVGHGDRVFTLLGRCPELYTAVLGTLKNTSVLCPLFSAFGPDPVEQRLRLGDARVLVTTAALYRRKVAERRASLPGLEKVLIVGPGAEELPGTVSFDELMSSVSDSFTSRRPRRRRGERVLLNGLAVISQRNSPSASRWWSRVWHREGAERSGRQIMHRRASRVCGR
ncbi:AMP-binding protein [Streptomyces sp. NBC_01410]|uniref:AMP-binding protein n=1 Tax=Streptomyces sp. NBC_01410 TaxID=2903856 RepID=UPI0032470202